MICELVTSDSLLAESKNMKPDNDCYVFQLGPNDYYLCKSKSPHEGNCPFKRDYFLEHLLCYHPDRHELPKGIRIKLNKHET